MSSGATNGMASSLVFTPTQGIELHNPIAATERLKRVEEANKKYAPPLSFTLHPSSRLLFSAFSYTRVGYMSVGS